MFPKHSSDLVTIIRTTTAEFSKLEPQVEPLMNYEISSVVYKQYFLKNWNKTENKTECTSCIENMYIFVNLLGVCTCICVCVREHVHTCILGNTILINEQKSSALAFHWLQPPLHQAKSPLLFLKFQVPGSPTFSTLMAPSWLSQPTWAFPSDWVVLLLHLYVQPKGWPEAINWRKELGPEGKRKVERSGQGSMLSLLFYVPAQRILN